jgi:threonine aldolase
VDFSKGLGAPVGAALAGSRRFIDDAWVVKQRFGGAMRQAGIIAAAALYALDHHVDRLADDHINARALATGLAAIPGVLLDPATVETNLVYFELADAVPLDGSAFCHALKARGVRMVALGPRRVRAVTHLDVDAADVATAVAAVREVLAAA